MFQNAPNGDLHFIMDNQIVAISSTNGILTQNSIITKTVGNYGTSNPIVARTTLQAEKLLGASSIAFDQENSNQFREIVASYRDRLLTMDESREYLLAEIIRCDKEFNYSSGPIQLPQVTNLRTKVEEFLLNSKKTLAEISKLFTLFFNYQKIGPDYDSHLVWAKNHFSGNSIITKVLEANTTGDRWINFICDLRNRIEHPKENYWMKIHNIDFDPQTKKMISPRWSTENSSEFDLLHDIGAIINNTLLLSEDLVAGCINETLTAPAIFGIGSIPKNQIDPNLPFRWGIFTNLPNS